jgi:hypothetical protein
MVTGVALSMLACAQGFGRRPASVPAELQAGSVGGNVQYDVPKPGDRLEPYQRRAGENVDALRARTRAIMDKFAARTGVKRRLFHAKAHGCLEGSFTVADVRNPKYKVGVFKDPKHVPYRVVARFSNGLSYPFPDKLPDFRGLAVKLYDVAGEQLLPYRRGKVNTQDFVFLNTPTLILPNTNAALDLLDALATAGENFRFIDFLLDNFQVAPKVRYVNLFVTSVAAETYWTPGSIAFVDRSKTQSQAARDDQAVRLKAEPCSSVPFYRIPDPLRVNYLKDELIERAQKENICFKIYALPYLDAKQTPAGDPSAVWAERGKVFLGQLVFPKQSFDTTEQRIFCEKMSYSPWLGVTDHEPYDQVNRDRREIYEESQWSRGAE